MPQAVKGHRDFVPFAPEMNLRPTTEPSLSAVWKDRGLSRSCADIHFTELFYSFLLPVC